MSFHCINLTFYRKFVDKRPVKLTSWRRMIFFEMWFGCWYCDLCATILIIKWDWISIHFFELMVIMCCLYSQKNYFTNVYKVFEYFSFFFLNLSTDLKWIERTRIVVNILIRYNMSAWWFHEPTNEFRCLFISIFRSDAALNYNHFFFGKR